MDASSPWWPLAVAQALAVGRAPDVYPVPFQHWLVWHARCVLAGRIPAPFPGDLAIVHVALAQLEHPLPA